MIDLKGKMKYLGRESERKKRRKRNQKGAKEKKNL